MTNQGRTAEVYAMAGLSNAGIEQLAHVADRQIRKIHAMAELAAAQLGSSMLESLVPNCLANTMLACQVDEDALGASLARAGLLKPLAQMIAMSWQHGGADPALRQLVVQEVMR